MSVIKAYGIEVEDVLDGVMSKINIVGNTAATSNQQIITGLQNSASAMSAMGSTLEENIALFTAAQEITQDESKVGNALRSISMRIRGYDEETEQLSEELSNITGEVVDLTKTASNMQGVSLFTDATQTEYKSIYQYLKEISEIYDELGQKQQQELMEKLFGKNRASVGQAILQNFEAAEKAMKEVESRLRELFLELKPGASPPPNAAGLIGALLSEKGVYTFANDTTASDRNYRRGIQSLFEGAFAAYRNPASHDNLYISQPDNGEQALEITETMVRSGAVDIVIVDSVAALVPKAEIDGDMGDSHVGLQARLMSQALRKLTAVISKSNCIVIFINQLREKVGVMFGNPETTPGGRALKFYSTIRLEVRRAEQIKQGSDVIGNRVKLKVVKNKVAPPLKLLK